MPSLRYRLLSWKWFHSLFLLVAGHIKETQMSLFIETFAYFSRFAKIKAIKDVARDLFLTWHEITNDCHWQRNVKQINTLIYCIWLNMWKMWPLQHTVGNEVKNTHKITGIHRSPAVTKKFHTGGAAGHDCREGYKRTAIISQNLSLKCINQLIQQSGPAVLKGW